jgi:hypothetical protein
MKLGFGSQIWKPFKKSMLSLRNCTIMNPWPLSESRNGELRKLYKIELENGDKKQTVRLRPEGTLIAADEFLTPFDAVRN